MQENNFRLISSDLSMFDEGGTGGASAESGAPGVANPKDQSTPKVVYGKQDNADSEGAEGGNTDNSQEPSFEDLIKGKYKKEYDERVQSTIQRRFKDVKHLESQVGQYGEIAELLHQKYGTKTLDELKGRIDEEVVRELAYNNDMSPENYRRLMDADRIKRQEADRIRQEEENRVVNETVAGWYKQADAMRQGEYPDFDLRAEMANDDFLKLLKANVPVKTAYELLNFDNLKSKIAKDAQTQLTNTIQTKKQRPKESAQATQSGVIVKSDVASFTPADRAEIARRVARGEKVVL